MILVIDNADAAPRADLLSELDKFLKKNKVGFKNLTGIAVVFAAEGAEARQSFTASRLAATLGNALAYALKIPVAAVGENWTGASVAAAIKKAKVGQYISAKYSGEARITLPRARLVK